LLLLLRAPPILPPVNGFLLLDRDKFATAFCADVPERLAVFMADSQVAVGVDSVGGAVTEPAQQAVLVPGRYG
jgi:hypothetical protein